MCKRLLHSFPDRLNLIFLSLVWYVAQINILHFAILRRSKQLTLTTISSCVMYNLIKMCYI